MQKLFLDEERYVCFIHEGVFWTLRGDGWEAYREDWDYGPILATGYSTFPTERDLDEAEDLLQKLKEADEQASRSA